MDFRRISLDNCRIVTILSVNNQPNRFKMIKKLLFALAMSMLLCVPSCTETPEELDNPVEESETDDDTDQSTNKDEDSKDEEVEDSTAFDEMFSEENDTIMYTTSDYSTGKSYTRTIYVDAEAGDDLNDGLSITTPIQSLTKLAEIGITNGDEILLKGSTTSEHKGTIRIVDLTVSDAPIHIGSYGDCKARLNAQGEFAAVLVQGTSNVVVSDLKITADGYPEGVYATGDGVDLFPEGDCPTGCTKDLTSRYGVLIYAPKGVSISNHVVYNVDIHDIFYFNYGDYEKYGYSAMSNRPCREWSTSYETEYGWGVRVYAAQSSATINNCVIDGCNIHDVSHTGIKSNNNGKITNLWITKTNIYDCGGPGAQFNNVNNAKMDYCKTLRPGTYKTDGQADRRKWGRGSGMWCHTCDGFLFDHNYYYRSEGVADCCGAHMDIGNSNIIIQYCLSVDNCGGFIEILGKNYNCSYRYNISIDDGWRNVKYDALQQAELWDLYVADGESCVGSYGCLVTINGHTGSDYTGPYDTYIYNNTVICSEKRFDGYTNPFTVEFATSAEGILFANNIMYVPLDEDSDQHYTTTYSTHSLTQADDGSYYVHEEAVDYMKGEVYYLNGVAKKQNVYMTNAEIYSLYHNVRNNLYMTYDATLHSSKYPYAENILFDNGNPLTDSDTTNARYKDYKPLGGDPGFPFVGGMSTDQYTAEDAIPTVSSVVNRGLQISSYKLPTDATASGLSCTTYNGEIVSGLDVTTDFFGRAISTPIIGACVAQ